LPDSQPKVNAAGRPSVCRTCGAIVGAGQTTCAVCGASVIAAPARARVPRFASEGEARRFARAVLDRPYIFTIIFLAVNFFIFLLMWDASGLSFQALWQFPESVLLAFGAKRNDLITEGRQWWRFVTPMFIHVNLPHLLINMYSLWVLGPWVEKLYGSAKFVVFWIATGVAGVVASYLTLVKPETPLGSFGRFIFKVRDVPSAGASGALFGLVGVLFVFGIKFRHELPEGFKRAFGVGLLPVILINLFIGYLGRGFIDNAAHLGGLVSGAGLALVVGYRRPGERASIALTWQALRLAALALVALSFVKIEQHFGERISGQPEVEAAQSRPAVVSSEFLSFVKAVNDGQEAFASAVKGDPSGVDAALSALQAAPAPDIKADYLKRKLESLLQRAKLLVTTTPQREPKTAQHLKQLVADSQSWEKEYNEWLKSIGKAQAESQ
jgi:membrane associated rhomboid family serine protease